MADLAQTAPIHAPSKNQATLCIAYGVYGLPKETSGWQRAPTLSSGAVEFTSPNAVPLRFKPDILGSSPKNAEITDPASTKLLHAAMRASYPNDIEICFGDTQPPCVSHSFVLQQTSTSTLYGVSLKVWSKADEKRCQTIYQLRCRDENSPIDETAVYWIPYSLCFLSPYPLFNLLSDYLKGMWIHWSKSTNLFHAEEVSRILSFPAPRLQDLVRIDMQDYALAYQFPNHSSRFQNFAMWPLFSCLSVSNVVSILETALSPAGRIIFTTRYPAMLNIAAESVRLACRVYEWTGLYVPVAHCAAVKSLVEEKGPYIIGVTKECRRLINPPADALVVDLDQGLIQTRSPPIVFAKASSRQKFINKLSAELGSCDTPGVPKHLREAYAGGQLTPEGQVICIKGRIELVEEPTWWNQDGVLAACDHVCKKLAKNKGLKALTSGTTKKPLTTKISIRALQEIEREKSSNAREVNEAWLAYCLLKSKMGTEIKKLTKRNEFLLEELNTWKSQFEKFQLVAQDLTKQSLELKRKIEAYKVENKQLNVLIKERTLEYTQMKVERDTMTNTNDDLVKEKQHLKEKLRVAKKQNEVLLQQREEVEGVLQALKELIKTQPAALEDIIEGKSSEITELEKTTLHRTTTASSQVKNETRSLNANRKPVEQIETASAFERTLDMSSRHSQASKRSSITDVADTVVRERTREITSLINRITADCVAAIDRISVGEEEDSPFTAGGARQSMHSNVEVASSVSSMSQKRQSNMTSVSEAIADLDLPVLARTASVHSQCKSQKSHFVHARVQEIEI